MITESQKDEASILLNKLKLLISEAAYICDSKSLFTAIETGIDTAAEAAASAGAAGGGGGADAGGGGSSGGGGGAAGGGAAPEPCTSVSEEWLPDKLSSLKDEIKSTLSEIRSQIQNNI